MFCMLPLDPLIGLFYFIKYNKCHKGQDKRRKRLFSTVEVDLQKLHFEGARGTKFNTKSQKKFPVKFYSKMSGCTLKRELKL